MSKNSIFDEYGRKAQLYPALLILVTPLVTAVVLFPELMSVKGSLTTLLVGCGLFYLLANIAREAGKRSQKRLFPKGMPTPQWLGHRDPTLEAPTKRRYKAFLAKKIPGLRFPSTTEEAEDPEAADQLYQSAVRWLVDNTRNNQRVRQELTAYGFRRNLYGLRTWGLIAAIASATIAVWILSHRHGLVITAVPVGAQIIAILAGIVFPALWIFAVTPSWVRSAADCYAMALFGSCDLPEDGRRSEPAPACVTPE
ncbi:hypothetical protein [Thiocapsa rosea]|uniref:Uncharacterized protein n=1 Tax=Thiocapsa rosea TaxID=69360 RepID=A0A495UP42_9GAMM|nr:hypothetical protein [Thiocapsa rosea]RKT37975.1 hypothetical protein BDD21_5489 [Thiocapsa rosea]